MPHTDNYDDALEWIEDNFEPDDYDSFEDYIDDVRSTFQNDNLIDSIGDDLFVRFE